MTAVRFKMQEFLSLPQKAKFDGDFMDCLGECDRPKYTGKLTRERYHGCTQWRLAARSLYAELVRRPTTRLWSGSNATRRRKLKK